MATAPFFQTLETPIGLLLIEADDTGITAIRFVVDQPTNLQPNAHTGLAVEQLSEYFTGSRQSFSLALNPAGTAFQQQVWQSLLRIEYGDTASYSDIANHIGNPNAVRAVGAANGKNPISIVVPCHRIIGKDGSLTGYAGGMVRKSALLKLEQSNG